MKITKSVLSILAIAISSSAFASTSTETNYAKITADAYARATHSLRGESGSTDSKNERTMMLIKSSSDTAYTYKVYSEQELNTVPELSKKLSNIGLSDELIYRTVQAQLDESRKDSACVAQLNDVREIDASLRVQSFASVKSIIDLNMNLGELKTELPTYANSQLFAYTKALYERKGWASVIAYLYGQEIDNKITTKEFNQVVASLQEYENTKEKLDSNSLPTDTEPTKTKPVINTSALQFFGINISPTGDFELAKPQSMRDGAEQVAADFKAQENAKAISEFNNLQELALKESDPAVKNLIKQAAILKLAGYAK
ncbi:hypothetical protein [Pseudomonas ficuserectae]|uniref:hypothetical protein n=1 Tax=Pseudomonas ficuserectae TaxID=53410 RepID=UPI0006E554BB|nr:hypothetical protein [Pseudomonas ficuserectae]KPX33048.1 hypothetical protein ALO69_200090 [Pseudomonas ficuserectae]RMS31609.1 hypothetical protein ALP68_05018 [Pseudomonas ficuserectae]RMS32304.1 hypothetical protein ALP67_05339 [Pseudomonas ficuserectae]